MNTQIKCPHCNKSFEPSQAYRHELEEKFVAEIKNKYQKELDQVLLEKKLIEEGVKTEIEKAKKNTESELRSEIEKRVKEEVDEKTKLNDKLQSELKDTKEQIESFKKRAEAAEEEEIRIRREKRELEESKKKFEIEKERQLDAEREKIRENAVLEIAEKDKFKFAEYEKKISDMSKALEEARKKGDQGSQQLQGEVLELDVENLLKQTFPDDEIIPVGKGQQGGDIIHKVKGKTGKFAGIILWETKRAGWQKTWIPKLREDARKEGATMSVLLSINLPAGVNDFKLTEGVIICSYKYYLPLAAVLRRSVLHIAFAKQTAESKDENLEMLYEYLQSEAFRHRFEAFSEGVVNMEIDLDYERRAMERVWKKREIQIKKMKINAARM